MRKFLILLIYDIYFMSVILSIETSSDACSMALGSDEQTYYKHIDLAKQHSQALLPMLQDLLQQSGLSVLQLDAISYSSGPGSFTGLRIGLSVAQGVSFAADIPLIAVSSLANLAMVARQKYSMVDGDQLFVAVDARMDEVYWSIYEIIGTELRELIPATLSRPDELADGELERDPKRESVCHIGSGFRYPSLAQLRCKSVDQTLQPNALQQLQLARPLFHSGNTILPAKADLSYLRDSVAWKKRTRIRT